MFTEPDAAAGGAAQTAPPRRASSSETHPERPVRGSSVIHARPRGVNGDGSADADSFDEDGAQDGAGAGGYATSVARTSAPPKLYGHTGVRFAANGRDDAEADVCWASDDAGRLADSADGDDAEEKYRPQPPCRCSHTTVKIVAAIVTLLIIGAAVIIVAYAIAGGGRKNCTRRCYAIGSKTICTQRCPRDATDTSVVAERARRAPRGEAAERRVRPSDGAAPA